MANVVVVANGVPFTGWLEVTVEQSFDKAAGHASIKLSEQPGRPVPIKLGHKVQILIDGRPVITGHVHEFHGEHSDSSHTMTVTVRDKTQDLIDSTVGPKLKLKAPISLKQMAEKTLKTMGLSDIKVFEDINTEPFKEGEVPSASIDDRGFSFLDQWAQKRQALMNTDGKGNLNITRNKQKRAPGSARLVKRYEDSPINNVLKAAFRNSDLQRHNSTNVNGQKSPNDKKHWEGKSKGEKTGQANAMQRGWGSANDTEVRPQRKLHARGTKGLSGGSPGKAAKWRSSAARRKGFQYTATVAGFYAGPPGTEFGWLWWPGFLVPVVDEHFEISSDLLIVDVKFHKTWSGGETTEVACTLPDAYTDKPGGSKAASRTAKTGAGSVAPGTHEAGDAGIEEQGAKEDA